MDLLWLDQQDCTNPVLVGGKAAMLARLTHHYQVPFGFCVALGASAEALAPSLQQAIAAAYTQLVATSPDQRAGVAVRSSAVDEDACTASFAGLHETILNVTNLPDLLAAIERCRASARSARALAYRHSHGLPNDEIPFAVLVQQMVTAQSSAVAFSVDPVSGQRDRLIINATWGVGDTLVGGEITADHFVLRRGDLSLIDQQIAHKMTMRQLASAGVISQPLAAEAQRAASLRAEQLAEIAQLVLQLEGELGWPVDVECAYQAGTLYLLQCRPITTLVQKAELAALIDIQTEATLSDAWAIEWDQPQDGAESWLGGRDFVLPLQQSLSLYYYQGWAKAFRELDVTGGLRARFVNGYEYRLWQWTPRQSYAISEAAARQQEIELPARWANEWLPVISADVAQWNALTLTALTNNELARHLLTMLARQLEHWAIHAVMGDAPLRAVGRLVDWYLQRFPNASESEPYRLVQGQANSSTEANHQLWHLGRLAQRLQLVEQLRNEPSTPPDLPAEFQRVLDDYCQRFGQLTREQQQRTRHLIANYALLDVPDPNEELKRLADERDLLIEALGAKLTAAERTTFDKLLACALANNPLTESHNLYLDQMSNAATQRVIAEFAQRLYACGSLTETSEVDYLSLYELLQWGYGLGNPLRSLVAQRKSEYAGYRALTPPTFIGKAPPPPDVAGTDRFGGPTAPLTSVAGSISGIGASAGIVRGRALVAKSLDEAMALQQGDILVCRSSDPTWTPLFAIAGGLVTDFGGSLSHAAVVAREYRLPAVVGTHVATQQIVTGQWVEVDGLNGVIRLQS